LGIKNTAGILTTLANIGKTSIQMKLNLGCNLATKKLQDG
jgi:hypothetical protein